MISYTSPTQVPKKKMRKTFVLDIPISLYDYEAVKNFQDNEVAIPISILEEFDTFK